MLSCISHHGLFIGSYQPIHNTLLLVSLFCNSANATIPLYFSFIPTLLCAHKEVPHNKNKSLSFQINESNKLIDDLASC